MYRVCIRYFFSSSPSILFFIIILHHTTPHRPRKLKVLMFAILHYPFPLLSLSSLLLIIPLLSTTRSAIVSYPILCYTLLSHAVPCCTVCDTTCRSVRVKGRDLEEPLKDLLPPLHSLPPSLCPSPYIPSPITPSSNISLHIAPLLLSHLQYPSDFQSSPLHPTQSLYCVVLYISSNSNRV
jgi:hypothetical protein